MMAKTNLEHADRRFCHESCHCRQSDSWVGCGQRVAHLVEDILKDKAVDFEILYTNAHRHGIELAEKASRNHEVVAALGGDGTVGEVLEGILYSKSCPGNNPRRNWQ